MRRSLLAVTAATAAVLLPTAAAQASEGDIIVKREPGLDAGERRELRAEAGVQLVAPLSLERTELVEPKDGDIAGALAELRADDDVVYAEPDGRVTASVPNDFWWPKMWGLDNANDADIDAPEAWLRSSGSGVTVAVADTGVLADHQDLAGKIADNPAEVSDNGLDDDGNGYADDTAGWDFVSNDNVPQDGHGHGTHVAGTIAATGDNGTGVIGVAPEAKVLPLRVLDNAGSGSMSDLAEAFDYAGKMGVRIVNASLGGGRNSAVKDAIAAHPNTLYVIAAGNANVNNDLGSTTTAYPCAFPDANIVCVGATDDSDARAGFSNYGATTVDLFAPGVDILSAWGTSPVAYVWTSGTSMATPHVAGAAALAFAANPGATAFQLKWALTSSVDAKPGLAGLAVTGGRLNANAAVAAITGDAVPTPTPESTATATGNPPVATPAPPVAPATPAPPAPAAPVFTPAPTVTPVIYLFDVTVGGSLTTKRSKLRVRFSLTKAAPVRFSVARRGSKKPLATWTSNGRSGANRVTIARRLPTGRTLKPGAYTLAVGLNASATSSRAIRVR